MKQIYKQGVSIPKDARRSLRASVKAKAMRTVTATLWESFILSIVGDGNEQVWMVWTDKRKVYTE